MKRKSEDLAYRPEKCNNIYLIWSFNGFGFKFYLLNTLSMFTLIKYKLVDQLFENMISWVPQE